MKQTALTEARFTMTRRNFLQAGIAAAMAGSLSLTTRKHITEEERLQLYNAFIEGINTGWKLFARARNEQVLAGSLAQLILLQQVHSILPTRERSALYASIYNLMGTAFRHEEHHSDALEAHTNAYNAALGDGNTLELINSLLCQANSYSALGQYGTSIEAINQAIRTLDLLDEQQHMLTKAQLLGVWTDSAIMMGDFKLARQKLDEIAALLDSISPNESFDQANWYQLSGKCAYQSEDFSGSAQWYEQALKKLSERSILRLGLVLMPLISTYTVLQDLDASLNTIRKVIPIIRSFDSPIMHGPLIQTLQGLLIVFPHEAKVKTIISDLLATNTLMDDQKRSFLSSG